MRKLQKEKERAAEDSDTREPMPTRIVRGGGESGGEGGGEGGGESGGGPPEDTACSPNSSSSSP